MTFKNVLYYNPAGHAHDCVQGIKPLCGSQSAQVNAQSPKTFVVYYSIRKKENYIHKAVDKADSLERKICFDIFVVFCP